MSEEEELKPLTEKQKIFCREYVIDWNATRAAKEAGYSENTATEMGYENLTKPHIKAYIEEVQQDLAKLCGVSAARNINELSKIAYSNLSDFKDGWMTEKDFDGLTVDQKAALSEIQHTETPTMHGTSKIVKFKLHDKQKAIEIMNKMLGWNASEKLDINDITEQTRKNTSDLFPEVDDIKKE